MSGGHSTDFVRLEMEQIRRARRGGLVGAARPGVFALVGPLALLALAATLAVLAGCGSEKTSEPDTTAPATVADLRIQVTDCDNVTLAWTAPGDDGGQGLASAYDLRYSTATITEANWAGATQWTGEPAPKTSGQTENVTVSDLAPGVTYYFALKTRDSDGNEAVLSNVASSTVASPAIPWVYDGLAGDEDWATSSTTLSANWAAATCAEGYEYAIGTTAGAADVVGWASSGGASNVTNSGLSLVEGQTYYFSARARLGTGYGAVTSSDGIRPDTTAPASSVEPLVPETNIRSIQIIWGGSDVHSGIKHYDVQVSDGSDPWQDWLSGTHLTRAYYSGLVDHTYRFRCRAVDNAGNVEAYPETADAKTVITCAYAFTLKWAVRGADSGQIGHPHGLAAGGGFVYLTETSGNRVQKFTSEGDSVAAWGTSGEGAGEFSLPCGIAVDDSGYVYVVDVGNKRVQKFSAAGQFVAEWGRPGTGDGEFMNPRGIAVDPLRYVYVADMDNNCVQKFTRDGEFVARWGELGTGDGQMNAPSGVAVGVSGTIYVSEFGGGRVQQFTASGEFLAKWGEPGTGNGQFHGAQFIAVDAAGRVYVSDYNNHRIQKFTAAGVYLTRWGSQGMADGQFAFPMGVAVDLGGLVYVSDYDNGRVEKFTPTCP
jgi:sugar lactone lactonase YvrE